jgi:hypothetical protein
MKSGFRFASFGSLTLGEPCMVNALGSHGAKRLAFVCVFLIATACFGQTGQSRHLAYSTYVYPEPVGIYGSDFLPAAVAANASGQVCASSGYYQLKINADGTQAYFISNEALFLSGGVDVMAMDAAGNCYLDGGGSIKSTPGAFQGSKSGNANFVMKLDPNGNIVFATYLGGSGQDAGKGIAVDASGNVWVTGSTNSNDFPTKNPIQSTFQGGSDDAFVAELSPDGTQLLFGTYLGGSAADAGAAIAVDTSGAAYITGETTSANFPTLNPLESKLQANLAAFVTKVSASGTLLYSTYLGLTSNAAGTGIAVDSSQDMYVTGTAPNDGFPLVNPLQTTSSASFISKLNPAGSALLYSTYFGTGQTPGSVLTPVGIQVDTQGNAYVAGNTIFGTVPLLNAIESTPYGGYIAGLDTNGALIFSSYYGIDTLLIEELPVNMVESVAIDGAANLYLGSHDKPGTPIPLLDAIYGTLELNSYGANYNMQPFVSKIALGPGPSFALPLGVDFGNGVGIGTSEGPVPVGVFNTGTTDISISSIVASADYSQTNDCPATLNVGTDCQLQVTFSPTKSGADNGTITITDNSPGSPHVIQLTGNDGVPAVTLNPTGLNFGSQQVGTVSGAQVITLTNTGTGPLNIADIYVSGDFGETNTCGFELDPGLHCTLSVTFAPTASGQRSGTLFISDNAPNSPETASLSGTGAGGGGGSGLGLGIAPGGSSSATVSAGGTANYSVAIGGAGVSGTATLTCTGAPTGAICSLPSSINVSGSSSSPFTVSVKTTGNSARLAPLDLRLRWMWAMGLVGVMLVSGGTRNRWTRHLLPFFLLLCLCGCGGGSGSSSAGGGPTGNTGTPTGSYTLTVQATMGSAVQSMPLTLKVQ